MNKIFYLLPNAYHPEGLYYDDDARVYSGELFSIVFLSYDLLHHIRMHSNEIPQDKLKLLRELINSEDETNLFIAYEIIKTL